MHGITIYPGCIAFHLSRYIPHYITPLPLSFCWVFLIFLSPSSSSQWKATYIYLLLSHWDTHTHTAIAQRARSSFFHFFCNPAKINVKCRKRCFAMTTRSFCHTRVQSDKEATTTKSSVPSSIYNKPRANRHRLIRGTPEHE